jgi:hypothetical protein
VHNYHVTRVDLEKASLKTGKDPLPEKLFVRWEAFRKSVNSNVIHHHKYHTELYYFCKLRFVNRKTEINSESRIPPLNVINTISIPVKNYPNFVTSTLGNLS